MTETKHEYGIVCHCGQIIILDKEDAERLKSFSFCHNGTKRKFKVVTYIGNKAVNIGRLVCPIPDGLVPDHINGNVHDNRRENIRPATAKQNSMNHGLNKNNSSGFIGVSWYRWNQKWCARIGSKHIGLFDRKEDAVAARDAAALKLYGEFARLNIQNKESK